MAVLYALSCKDAKATYRNRAGSMSRSEKPTDLWTPHLGRCDDGRRHLKSAPQPKFQQLEPQPRPTNGIVVAITVMNSTLASSGRLAM